jgi:putative transposase
LVEFANEYIQTASLPPDIISYAVWLYYRFNLSHRDIEDLLAERGITVRYEMVGRWRIKLGAMFARSLKRQYQDYGGAFYIASLA